MFRRLAACAMIFATLATPHVASAQTLGVSTFGGTSANNGSPWVLGYSFNVTSAFTVTNLAFFDAGGDGLVQSHEIGLWSPTGALLASATVDAGSGAPLLDGFRLAAIDPFTLAMGLGYRVGGVTGNELYNYGGALSSAPGIEFAASAYCLSTTLVDPTCGTDANNGYFGASFAGYSGTVTPEPSSLVLMGTALIGVLATTRKRRRHTS